MADKDNDNGNGNANDGGGGPSLEFIEANALRLKLGLPLLREEAREVGGANRAREGEEVSNAKAAQESLVKERAKKVLIEKIKVAKEMAQFGNQNTMTVTKGLGEESSSKRSSSSSSNVKRNHTMGKDDDDDAATWAASIREKTAKKQRKIHHQMEEEEALRLREKELDYNEGQLEGLKVAHNMNDLDHDSILILKDRLIGEEDDGDELMNVTLQDKEILRKNLAMKKGPKLHNAYDEFERSQAGLEKKILSRYDDPTIDEEGDEGRSFILGASGKVDYQEHLINVEQKKKVDLGGVSLDYEKTKEIADFYTQDEMVSFKKGGSSKKKKKKNSRKKLENDALDQDGAEEEMQEQQQYEEFANSNKKSDIQDFNFVDDDDLQEALSKSRKKANQKENVASRILEQAAEEAADEAAAMDEDEGGLVISDLTEFVGNLSNISTLLTTTSASRLESRNYVNETAITADEEKEDEEMGTDGVTADHIEEKEEDEDEDEDEEEEDDLADRGGGLAATLARLSSQGDIKVLTDAQKQKDAVERERSSWLAEQRRKDAALERLAEREREARKTNKLKEFDYEARKKELERERAFQVEKKFEGYKPNVELHYRDNTGRELNPKEAFKILAQKFHGNTSGKKKTEKKLIKLQEELMLKKMSSTDTPLGTANLFIDQTKSLGSAHLTLSKGGKMVIPEQAPQKPKAAPISKRAHIITQEPVAMVEEVIQVVAPAIIPPSYTSSALSTTTAPSILPEAHRPKIAFGLAKTKLVQKSPFGRK